MRVVLQRVSKASCTVDGTITGQIDNGYLILVGFTNGDDENKIKTAVKKIINLRVFDDENHKMNLNLNQVNGSILSISQFTLYANTNGGNRPSFTESLNPTDAKVLYQVFNDTLRQNGIHVEEGIFGAHMEIALINDGPVTITLEF
jgi:D-tyrosyl-tRNA(Tyr) deacylase